MKHVQACLSVSKGGKSSFHYCRGPVKLVQACLCAKNTLQCHLYHRGRAVNQVKACLSIRKDLETSFHQCGGPVKPVLACLCA